MTDDYRSAIEGITITLPGERPKSLNTFFARAHWNKRTEEVDRVKLVVRAAIDIEQAEIFPYPVDVSITVYFDKSPLDPDNIVAKLYIDALKGLYLEDDTFHHIVSLKVRSVEDKKKSEGGNKNRLSY